MAINLVKGQKIDLTKGNADLDEIMVGLGWDPVKGNKGILANLFGTDTPEIDCDASAIMLGVNDKLRTKKDVIYFGNLSHESRSVQHMGDNLTGDGDGDDEQIFVKLSKVPQDIQKIVFIVNIYDCAKRRQDFGMIQNAFIRIVDNKSRKELVRFNLTDNYSGYTALIVGEVYRHNGEWKFAAIGQATHDLSIKQMLNQYL